MIVIDNYMKILIFFFVLFFSATATSKDLVVKDSLLVTDQIENVRIISGGVLQLTGIAADIYVEEGGRLILTGIANNITNSGGNIILTGIVNVVFANSGYTEIRGIVNSHLLGKGEIKIIKGSIIGGIQQ